MTERTRLNDAGFLEGYDDESGEVLWVEKRKTVLKDGKLVKASSPGRGRPKKEDLNTHHYVTSSDGQKLWVPKGTNPGNLPRSIWPFNQVTADLICERITEGLTIKAIAQIEGYPPPHIIHRWARKYPEFKRELREAAEDRATLYHDEVMEVVSTTSKDTINEDRFKTELLKWGAEIGDPHTYGKRTKITGDPSAPLSFIISTGVPQAEDKPVEIEATRTDEE